MQFGNNFQLCSIVAQYAINSMMKNVLLFAPFDDQKKKKKQQQQPLQLHFYV